MFKGEDRKALQTLIDNGLMTTEHMKTPRAIFDSIATTIKLEEHFWAHRDELLSDLQQQPGEGIHALSQHICALITQPLRYLNLWSCSMLPGIMRLGTG